MQRPRKHAPAVSPALIAASTLCLAGLAACAPLPTRPQAEPPTPPAAHFVTIASPQGTPRPPFHFSPADEELLDQVQHGAFNFLWMQGSPERGIATGMAPDRTSKTTVSVAGVGFQLSGICVGVERGWITRDQGRERCELVLKSLLDNPDNRKAGLFYHFIDGHTAGQPPEAGERCVSTADSALLMAGVLTASQYFGANVQTLADRLFTEADWHFFICPPDAKDPQTRGFLSLGWNPKDVKHPGAEGTLLPYAWVDNGDEHRLATFLGICAPQAAHRIDPVVYYRMRRQLGQYKDSGPIVWFPWSGALFTAFFAHCWIDYAAMGPDDPTYWNVPHRAHVDWWENSRRTARMHRRKAAENPLNLPGFGEHAWGLTASDVNDGYAVPGLFPDPLPMPGASQPRDLVQWPAKDDWGNGTIAPYAAGCSILFDPEAAVAALRHYQTLDIGAEQPLWDNPATGGYGFRDAFNAGQKWVAPDCVSIDQGPLLLAIENARTGLIWKTFHAHPFVRAGMERLKLHLDNPKPADTAHTPPAR